MTWLVCSTYSAAGWNILNQITWIHCHIMWTLSISTKFNLTNFLTNSSCFFFLSHFFHTFFFFFLFSSTLLSHRLMEKVRESWIFQPLAFPHSHCGTNAFATTFVFFYDFNFINCWLWLSWALFYFSVRVWAFHGHNGRRLEENWAGMRDSHNKDMLRLCVACGVNCITRLKTVSSKNMLEWQQTEIYV